MPGLSALIYKLWQTLPGKDAAAASDLTHEPLLDRAAIADLRRRAVSLTCLSTTKSVLHKQHGEHLSSDRGYGLDYEESRVYQPGDEVRFMNWRLAARTGEPHIKVFLEERQPSAFIMLDWRNSMRFGTQVRLKATQALRAAILLAFHSHLHGRSVSALVVDDDGLRWLKKCADESSVTAMANDMNRACPPHPNGPKPAALEPVLRAIQSALIAGTQVYVISDFIDAGGDCQPVLAHLAHEHEIRAVHIVDPAEQHLPRAGNLLLSGTPDERERRVNLSNPRIAAQYQSAARRHLAERESLLRGLGIGYARLLTTTDDIETRLVFT